MPKASRQEQASTSIKTSTRLSLRGRRFFWTFIGLIQTPIQKRAAPTAHLRRHQRPSPTADLVQSGNTKQNKNSILARFGNLLRPTDRSPQRLLAISGVLSRHKHSDLDARPGLVPSNPLVAWLMASANRHVATDLPVCGRQSSRVETLLATTFRRLIVSA